MSKSTEEIKKELQRIREEEEFQFISAKKQRIMEERALQAARDQDELVKGRTHKDPQSGQEVAHWDDAMRKAEAAVNSEVMSYNDWRAAMMGLLTMYGAMNKGLHQSIGETVHSPLATLIKQGIIYPLGDKIKDKLTGNPEIDLPMLQHEVSFSNDNKLVINPLTRSDKGAEKGQLDKLFEKGIRLWLENAGYTPDPADNAKFIDENGVQLDKAAFDALKSDPVQGLEHFLKEYSPEVEFRPMRP